MRANPILLQMKYSRIVEKFAREAGLERAEALDFFYRSETYWLMSQGISDMHCMSDGYLVDGLLLELRKTGQKDVKDI